MQSCTGRDVLYVQARVKPEGRSRAFALPLCVGTSHLESPCGPDCVPVRIGQLAEALGLMSEATAGDVVYGGVRLRLPAILNSRHVGLWPVLVTL